jgi:hypothetical protein
MWSDKRRIAITGDRRYSLSVAAKIVSQLQHGLQNDRLKLEDLLKKPAGVFFRLV